MSSFVPGRLRSVDDRLPSLKWFVLILALVWAAYWVGVRTKGAPTNLHSLGVVVQVQGRGAASRGLNLPSSGPCRVCGTGADIMRYNPGDGLRVDMVVSVHPKLMPPSCGDATVDMVISGSDAFWEQHNGLGPDGVLTKIAVGWDGATHVGVPPGVTQPSAAHDAPALTVFYDDPQAPLHPGFYLNSDLLHDTRNAHQTMVRSFPPGHPVGLWTQIYNWGHIRGTGGTPDLHQWPLHLHFVTNWVAPRGWGSCYVLLPSLLANGAFAGTENALEALRERIRTADPMQLKLLSEAQPPTAARTALVTDGSISIADTSPAPTDLEAVFFATHGTPQQRAGQLAARSGGTLGPVWACSPADDLSYLTAAADRGIPPEGSFAGDACGAVAVVDAPGASDFRAVFLIMAGVLIALAVERFFSSIRKGSARNEKSPEDDAKASGSPDGNAAE